MVPRAIKIKTHIPTHNRAQDAFSLCWCPPLCFWVLMNGWKKVWWWTSLASGKEQLPPSLRAWLGFLVSGVIEINGSMLMVLGVFTHAHPTIIIIPFYIPDFAPFAASYSFTSQSSAAHRYSEESEKEQVETFPTAHTHTPSISHWDDDSTLKPCILFYFIFFSPSLSGY